MFKLFFFNIFNAERGFDDCLLGSQIDGYYRYEPFGGKQENLDKAATKIQSTFRGHRARQEIRKANAASGANEAEKTQEVVDGFGGKQYGSEEHAAAVQIQAGCRGYITRKELKMRDEAAIKIQAGYRGYTVRKGLKQSSERSNLDRIDEGVPKANEGNEELERNEGVEAAAIKIQSAFRGDRAREAVLSKKEEEAKDGDNRATERDRDLAAIKIQSNYRGYHTRKQIQERGEAATKIQAYYKGYMVRGLRRAQSEAAVKIQSYYRGYKTRKQLKKSHSSKNFLGVSNDDEFSLHRDSRTSFSLPEGVKFEGTLDEDSDSEIDKMVDQLEEKQKLKAIEEASSPDAATEDKGEEEKLIGDSKNENE